MHCSCRMYFVTIFLLQVGSEKYNFISGKIFGKEHRKNMAQFTITFQNNFAYLVVAFRTKISQNFRMEVYEFMERNLIQIYKLAFFSNRNRKFFNFTIEEMRSISRIAFLKFKFTQSFDSQNYSFFLMEK